MTTVTRLYTPDILALAVRLAGAPLDPAMPLQGHARSSSCGSTLALSMQLDAAGHVCALGLRAQACAIGQAAAALFLAGAPGLAPEAIRTARDSLSGWLAGERDLPDWPDLALLAAARDFPGRHGAIMLPWNAALDALSPA